jgi:general secretion pathway protein G
MQTRWKTKRTDGPFQQLGRRQSKAFTLIEVVTVLAIIAVLSGGVIYLVKDILAGAKIERARTDLDSIRTQLIRYDSATGRLPTTDQGLMALVKRPTAPPPPRNWSAMLEEEPLDPWKNPYRFQVPAQRSTRQYDLYSFGPDGIESEDDIGNWKKVEVGESKG